jgi:peptidoglycan/LPS O-acetylase OafA/YrhL
MPELDAIRGVAILMVIFYHGFAWSGGTAHLSAPARWFVQATVPGWLGVNLFFVLSGFLITGILLKHRSETHYYRDFYIRRALRILPAFYALVLALAVSGISSWQFLALSGCHLANLAPLFGVPVAYGMLWSLAVEEHFYLVWPAAARRLTTRGLAVLSACIIGVSPVLRLVAFRYGVDGGLNMYTWLVADGLACGALLAIVVRAPWCTRKILGGMAVLLIVSCAAALLLGSPFGILTRRRALGAALQVTPWNIGFAALLALVLLAGTSRWRPVVTVRVLRFFGEISYGLYLAHVGVFWIYDRAVLGWHVGVPHPNLPFGPTVVRFVVAGGAAIVLAWLSRHTYEQFFLAMKERLTAPPRRDASMTPDAVLIAGVAVASD